MAFVRKKRLSQPHVSIATSLFGKKLKNVIS